MGKTTRKILVENCHLEQHYQARVMRQLAGIIGRTVRASCNTMMGEVGRQSKNTFSGRRKDIHWKTVSQDQERKMTSSHEEMKGVPA